MLIKKVQKEKEKIIEKDTSGPTTTHPLQKTKHRHRRNVTSYHFFDKFDFSNIYHYLTFITS